MAQNRSDTPKKHKEPSLGDRGKGHPGNTSHIESRVLTTGESVCHVCDSIYRGFGAPEHKRYSAKLGTVRDILSGPCDGHRNLTTWFLGHMEGTDCAQDSVIVFKRSGERHLQFFREGTLYSPFELVDDTSHFAASGTEIGDTTCGLKSKACIRGRGLVLDKHWICHDTIKDWYRICLNKHGQACDSPPFVRHLNARPATLIDTWDYCLVSGTFDDAYLTLSYVWGHVNGLCLTKENATLLYSPGILRDKHMAERIPTTVLQAIDFTRALGERYLWVDSLCIVQDGGFEQKQQQLSDMTAIYANSRITIIAADGTHADYGLRGFQQASRATRRTIHQEIIPFAYDRRVVERLFHAADEPSEECSPNTYYQRAWTFQEYTFAKRRVVFLKNSVLWECCCTTWFEDVRCDGINFPRTPTLSSRHEILTSVFPRPYDLTYLITEFNKTQLTYEGDCLAAFAGMASALSLNFDGGFICGLPELFFDLGLLWMPYDDMTRRHISLENRSFVQSPCLPSWSWAGWAGGIDPWSWQSGQDFLKRGGRGLRSTRETFAITKWQVLEYISSVDACKEQRVIDATWYDQKERYRDPNYPLPEGWKRHKSRLTYAEDGSWSWPDHPPPEGYGTHFYTHDSCPSEQFWYPIPIWQPGKQPTRSVQGALLRSLSALEKTVFYTGGVYLPSNTASVSIEDYCGRWAGVLRPHRRGDLSEDVRPKMQPLEMVAISRGTALNFQAQEPALEEWDLEERPKDGRLYEFYNVLWIGRNSDSYYRRGIGRVHKTIWEQQRRESIQLTLD